MTKQPTSLPSLSHHGSYGLKYKKGWGRAPATVANVGPGFDLLGFALSSKADEVDLILSEVSHQADRGVQSLQVEGDSSGIIPLDPMYNVTTVALNHFIEQLDLMIACDVILKKGIPVSSGLGGSAASAVVGVIALNSCLNQPCHLEDLLPSCLMGEAVASGAPHADNVAPCLFGGLTLCLPYPTTPPSAEQVHNSTSLEWIPQIQHLPVVEGIAVLMAHPQCHISTKEARAALSPTLTLEKHTRQLGHLAGFLASCFQNDRSLLKAHLCDVLIAPQRASLIEGFIETQTHLIKAGAFGCEISGAGPSLFALCNQEDTQYLSSELNDYFSRYHSLEVWSEPWGAKGARGKGID